MGYPAVCSCGEHTCVVKFDHTPRVEFDAMTLNKLVGWVRPDGIRVHVTLSNIDLNDDELVQHARLAVFKLAEEL